jgi:hypothetical protein
MMMKKLIALVLVLTFGASALADDLIPAPWANDGYNVRIPGPGGSLGAEWTYDDPCGVYDYDWADNEWFVSHPDKGDPCVWGEPGFAGQFWGSNDPCWGDPCMPWVPSAFGRTGLVDFVFGSWDLNNFVHDQPAKDMWIQITYQNPLSPGTPVDIDWAEGGFPGGDPWGWWEGLLDPCDPCSFAYYEGPVDDWPTWAGDPLETWEGETLFDIAVESTQVLGDDWIHEVYSASLPTNPTWEYFAIGYVSNILIDQVVIETLCYVPEPATMMLLGLGSLLMIRRKK